MAHKYGIALLIALLLLPASVRAQELTPRAYWPLPEGTNVVVLSYQNSSGDVVTDPSLPLTGVDSTINSLQASYQRTVNFFGRSSNVQISLPFSDGDTEGFVEGEFRTREVKGLSDVRGRVSINLKGAPNMDRADFQALRKDPRTIIGASLSVQAPVGEYENDKAINLGTNRWSVKPGLGVVWPINRTWLLEYELGASFFSDNDNFLGQTREQEPILSNSFHLIRRFRPGFWASLDVNFYVGGRSTIGGEERGDLQRNSRMGATLVFPIGRGHALRTSYSTGVVTESGGDFETFSLSYVYVW